ncbi:hypothetical protein [Aquiflexum gelatinilyticum]|uniref:hypothetical protein n=1 Tax=Aquiflexum gelatinilyticum TaxID=2961943 RepID=UPI002168E720|nr:hypothetical protein [Aquiflexum gelatinilyticum]MCS4433949.1 hypothetical protein [Aquiflexum gelatinilyticum]
MFKLFKVFLIFTMLFLASRESYGQAVYTTSGLCPPNQSNYFGTPLCWIKSGTDCPPPPAPPSPSSPPVFGTLACPVTIIINHPIDILTSFNLGTRVNLIVNVGGEFNVSGNLFLQGQAVSNLVIDGGQLNVNSSILMNQGTTSNNTIINIQTINSGELNVNTALDLRNNTLVQISGDDTGKMEVGNIDLGQKAIIDVLDGGRLISNGDTEYAGNDSEINVWGYFNTASLTVSGGSGKQLNVFGDGDVLIDGDLTIAGTSQITFGGDSNVYIEGDVIINGSGDRLIIKENAKVAVCGNNTDTDPPPGTVNKEGLNECSDPNNCPTGGYYVSCRILPVDYLYIESEYSKASNSALLSWATAKEWENSRFEIERSLGDISDFIKIGEVSGMGWKDTITEYEYVDANLPLAGGNIYYRLKQVDMNGKFSLSKVLSVKMPSMQFTQGVWRAYPNPTDGHQFRIGLLDISQYSQEKISFRIIQPNHVTEVVTVDSEAEMNEYLIQILPTISSGIFVVELQWGQKIEHIKVLKQK